MIKIPYSDSAQEKRLNAHIAEVSNGQGGGGDEAFDLYKVEFDDTITIDEEEAIDAPNFSIDQFMEIVNAVDNDSFVRVVGNYNGRIVITDVLNVNYNFPETDEYQFVILFNGNVIRYEYSEGGEITYSYKQLF